MVVSKTLICLILVLKNGFSFSFNENSSPEISEDYNSWKTFAKGNTVTFFKFFTGKLDFDAAMEDCRKRGGDLPSFHSLKELKLIFEEASTVMNSSGSFWTGLYHNGERVNGLPNLKMYFTDGTIYDLPTSEEFHRKIWGPLDDNYQPDGHQWAHSQETEYCVEVTNGFGSLKYFLNDVTCSTKTDYYVCMRKYAWEKPGRNERFALGEAEISTTLPWVVKTLDSAAVNRDLDLKQEINPDNGGNHNSNQTQNQQNGLQSTDATQDLQENHRDEVPCVCGSSYSSSLYSRIAEIGFPISLLITLLILLGFQRSSLPWHRLLGYSTDSYEFNGNGNNVCLSNIS